ncbi:MAG: WYL domain-containing protein [Leptospiraceae bacterium]|nr:WYL domain-containing protein [Leptospiraceae bacterium]MCP5502216.1 WYL domain-containing protein [Leptospiraceae bacterium]
MNPTIDRLNKKLGLIKILSANPGMKLEDLARFTGHNGIDKLKKDLGELFMVGSYPYTPADYIEIDYNGDNINIHLPVNLDSSTQLNISEWLVLLKIIESESSEAIGEEKEILEGIKSKIKQVIPFAEYSENREIRKQINQAIKERTCLWISYLGRKDIKPETRKLEPLFIFQLENQYLAAYCHTRKGIRNFRLESIIEAKPTQETFTFKANIDNQKYIEDFNRFIQDSRQNSEYAEILFDEKAYFHLSGKLDMELLGEKTYRNRRLQSAKVKISDSRWFLSTIKGFGTAVIILSPESLRTAFLEDVKNLAVPGLL